LNWPTIKMDELAAKVPYSLVGGPFGSKLTSRDYINDGIPVIRGSNLGKGKFLSLNEFVYVSNAKMRQDFSSNLAYPGDLVFTQRGTLGQVAIIPEESPFEKYVISQSQMKMTVDEDKASKEYLYYYFTSTEAVRRIINYTSSSGVPHINLTILRNFEVPVPPVRTQRAIASTLSAYDDLIENNRRRIKLLEEAARLLYQEWFVRLRFPGHEHVKIKDGVPEGWGNQRLCNIAEITMGQSPKSKYYNEDGKGLPFHQGVTNFGVRFPTHHTYCTLESRIAEAGDILFSVRAPVGRINITLDKIVIGRGISAIRSVRNQQNFLFYALKSYFFKEDMIGSGAIFAAITKNDLFNVELLQPTNRLIEMFSDYICSIDRQVESLHRACNKMKEARDLLLPRLMNGEIAV
jgi:type I restriction enzyme, S subunit